MIYESEYNIILDHWSNRFNIKLGDAGKTSIINMYKYNEKFLIKRDMDFNTMVEQIMIQSILEMKYPGLDLYEYVFAPWSRN